MDILKEKGGITGYAPGYRIVVRPASQKADKKLWMPDSFKEDCQRGTSIGQVVAVGKRAYEDPRFLGDKWCKVGDLIVYSAFDGKRMTFQESLFIILEDSDVQWILDADAPILEKLDFS